jgi:hypothetical protein
MMKSTMFVILALPMISALTWAQCQNQTCQVNTQGTCFACQGANGFACQVTACDSCTVKLCSNGTGGGVQGPRCENVPDHLPTPAVLTRGLIQEARFSAVASTKPGFMFAPISVSGSPAQLNSLTIDRQKALVSQASFVNIGERKITAYQMGWVAGELGKESRVYLSPVFEVPAGIDIGREANMPPQPLDASLMKPGIRAAFFIAKVRFSDGTDWKADLKVLKKKALGSLPGDSDEASPDGKL